jgi:hypothetical protein
LNDSLHRLVVEARDQVMQPLPACRVVLDVLPIHGFSFASGKPRFLNGLTDVERAIN